jgi:AraC-like DNA-binding protein
MYMGRLYLSAQQSPAFWHLCAVESGYRASELARLVRLSRRQLERRCRKLFAVSPQKWLNELKLSESVRLLATADSVKEIALTLGYKRVSHFCADFKHHYGLTCTEYLDRIVRHQSKTVKDNAATVPIPGAYVVKKREAECKL